jgi:predicted secreted protein
VNRGAESFSRILAAAAAVLLPVSAAAADKMSHSVLGWSPDGRYIAFERSVVLDGRGYPMCEVVIVDADSEGLSAGPFKAVLEDERISPEHACVAARNEAQSALEERRIDPALRGKRLKLAQVVLSGSPHGPGRITKLEFRQARRTFSIRLTQRPTPASLPDATLYGWELALTSQGKEHLMRCTECGKEPPAALDVAIVEVRSYRDRIAVFLERSTRGFEGTDVTPIVAASRLPGAPSASGN